jgi:hypothetical protein
MGDFNALQSFLTKGALRDLRGYTEKLGDKVLTLSGGAKARAESFSHIDFDEKTDQIVLTQTIEIRISGPDGVNVEDGADAGPARSRSARRRQAGARRDGAGHPHNVRH